MVKGVLKFEDPGSVTSGQRIRLCIQDTSRADADAIDVVEKRVTIPEDFDAEKDDLPFEIDLEDTREGLTLHAHLARHAGSDVRVGDMVTTASLPVSADDGEDVAVTLRTV